MAPPSGRLAAIRDALPPSSPEFSICKPYHDDEPEPKRRKGPRISKTYSERSRRLPAVPPLKGLSRWADNENDYPTDGYMTASSSTRDPASSDGLTASSPPSSPPWSCSGSIEARLPLAPIFLSVNERRAVSKMGRKDENGLQATEREDEESSIAVVLPPTPHQPKSSGNETPTDPRDSAEKEATDERSTLKGECRVKKEWPIFSRMMRTQPLRGSTKDRPSRSQGSTTNVSDDEPGNGDQRRGREPLVQQTADARHHVTDRPPSVVASSFGAGRASFGHRTSSVDREEDAVIPGSVPANTKSKIESDTPTSPPQSAERKSAQSSLPSSTARSEKAGESEYLQLQPAPTLDSSSQEGRTEPTSQGLVYNRPYREYVEAARHQRAEPAANSSRSKKPGRTVQTTLNLSTKLPFKECKLCDTVYNPLHPADVKLHQDVHDQLVRARGLGNLTQARKRRRRDVEGI